MVEGEERMIAFGNDVFLRNGWVDDSLRKWDGFLRNLDDCPDEIRCARHGHEFHGVKMNRMTPFAVDE